MSISALRTPNLVAAIGYVARWLPPVAAWVRWETQRHAAAALQFYRDGNLDAARADYREALGWSPHDADLRAALGQVCYELHQTEQAESEFRRALDDDYRNLRALQGLGNVLQDKGDMDGAMYNYLRYLEIRPKDAGVCLNLGVVFHNMGNFEKATLYYIEAEEAEPTDTLALKNHALALFALGRFPDAEALLARAQALAPADGEIDLLQGQAREAHDDYQGAEACYAAALEKNPKDAQTHLRSAFVTGRLGRWPEAIRHAEQAVELYHQAGDAANGALSWWELGWAYYRVGEWQRSIEASAESVKLDPKHAPVRFNRGLALLHLGRGDEARQEYLDGIGLVTQVADLKVHAIEDLSEALERNPGLPGGATILDMLKERYAAMSRELAKSAHRQTSQPTETTSP
ncbi:MAG: tetratricopeptide repeat protein [Bryobacteraceae bacterium]|jgi:tetratricopeptide (TPR) repeat protein